MESKYYEQQRVEMKRKELKRSRGSCLNIKNIIKPRITTYTIGQSRTRCPKRKKKTGMKSPVNMISKHISTALGQKALY